MNNLLPPFTCQFTPNFPEILFKLNCSLVISTYQAGKVIFISPKNEEELIQLPRTFYSPMGIAIKNNQQMAIATKQEVIMLTNSCQLAQTYPKSPNTYDALFMPMASYYTGQLDIHDLHFGKEGLWAVNSLFSCLCKIDDTYSFTPQWQPHFITELVAEDRCHLNGLAMEEGMPKYVTALGHENFFQSWRPNITKSGIVMDVEQNEILTKGLAMPHSPLIHEGKLYVLLSAAQKLVCIDTKNGQIQEVAHIPGFLRGMTRMGDYLFIATSKLRENSSTFRHLEIAQKANEASIVVLHLPTASLISKLVYLNSVDEIYDVQLLENFIRPTILNPYEGKQFDGLITPETTYWKTSEN